MKAVTDHEPLINENPRGYKVEATINGVEMSIVWNRADNCYSILFPQITETPGSLVVKNLSLISRLRSEAEKAFAIASQLAARGKNAQEIFSHLDRMEFQFDAGDETEESPASKSEAVRAAHRKILSE